MPTLGAQNRRSLFGRIVAAGFALATVNAWLPAVEAQHANLKPFEYVEANIPFYAPPSMRAGDDRGSEGADGWNQMQLPLDPAESAKHLVLPAGFEAKLFVAEPDIARPITMAWDERGRLWVAESTDYPNNLQPPGTGNDRIKICEDTDGDGRADKFTVFAGNLSIPTSITFADGGVIVHLAPETVFFKDTDGDDRADERRVLLRGWGTFDTHAGPSNLHWGLDNWIWGMIGYSGFKGTVGGEQHEFAQGFYRFRPDGSKMEFLRSNNNNTWGIGFSEEGIVFGSTANGNPSVYMPIANRYYERVRGWSASVLGRTAPSYMFEPITDRVRQVDWHNGYTAAAGHALYTARSYPQEYWNRTAFVAGPTGHLLGTFVLERQGSDFVSRNEWNLLASDDEWTAPTMAEVGPDGAVWMIDWYNYIVQHNPTPQGFETGKGGAYIIPLRDKTHGRIYRIVHKDSPPYRPMNLHGASAEALVAALSHDNMFWRIRAQRLLVERGKRDVVPDLIRLVADHQTDELGLAVGAIHALWTMHGLGALDGTDAAATAVAVAALEHPSAGVRRSALKVVPHTTDSARAILAAGVLTDPDAQVRLAAFLALADMPASETSAVAIARALNRPENGRDRWIPHAAISAGATSARLFLSALSGIEPHPDSRKALVAAAAQVAEHYARGGPVDSVGSLFPELAGGDARIVAAVIGGLAQGWPKDRPVALNTKTEKAMEALFDGLPLGAQGQIISLASAWGSQSFARREARIVGDLLSAIEDEDRPDDERIAAARHLIELKNNDDGVIDELLVRIIPRTSPELAAGLLAALEGTRSEHVGPALIGALPRQTPATAQAAMRLLLRRTDWTRSLLQSAEQGKVDLNSLALDQQQALTRHPNRKLARRARRLFSAGGGLPSADREKVLQQFMPVTETRGDAVAGKAVFTKTCSKCHVHSGEGTAVGPELSGMAVHPKAELLLQILDPSRNVEGNYRQVTVATTGGLILTGLLASETRTTIELFDAEGKKHVVLRADIDDLIRSSKSLMPDGFENEMSAEDFTNLLEFLTQKSKYIPVPIRKWATVVSTVGMFHDKENEVERLVLEDWSPKTFQGVPFHLVDPEGDRVPNVILLNGPNGSTAPTMPKSVVLPSNGPARAIHFLSGVSGWGSKGSMDNVEPTVSMIVRLHYADGQQEDHPLENGIHFADYIGRYDVPGSQFAFSLRDQQMRYFAITPKRRAPIGQIELVKGPDHTAPIVMAVTIETP